MLMAPSLLFLRFLFSASSSAFLESPAMKIIDAAERPQEPLTRRTDDSPAPQGPFASYFTVTPVSAAAFISFIKLD